MVGSIEEGVFVALFAAFVALTIAGVILQTRMLHHLRENHHRRWQELGAPGYWVGSWSRGTQAAMRDAVWDAEARAALPDELTRRLAAAQRPVQIGALACFGAGILWFAVVRWFG